LAAPAATVEHSAERAALCSASAGIA
jgi:hypothetical protein